MVEDASAQAGSGVGGRALVLVAAAIAFILLDAGVHLLSPAQAIPVWASATLVALALVASVGWLFIGKLARHENRSAWTGSGSSPAAPIGDILGALLKGIDRLGVSERTKDVITRGLAAGVMAALLFGWNLYISGVAAK